MWHPVIPEMKAAVVVVALLKFAIRDDFGCDFAGALRFRIDAM